MTSTLAFLDTEFTDLLNPELLSLALVSLDGAEQHYVELDLMTDLGKARVKASGDFVCGGVLDMWGLVPGATGTEWEMGRRTGEWLLRLAAESGTMSKLPSTTRPTTNSWSTRSGTRDSGIGSVRS